MIFILPKNYFKKHAKKLVEPADYFIIDGEDIGTSMTSGEKCIAEKYAHSTVNGNFTPPAKLFRLLKEKSDKFDGKKVSDVIEDFMDRKETKMALLSSTRAMFYDTKNNPKGLNIFIVLPNKVYDVIGKEYKKFYKKNFSHLIVYDKEDLKEKGYGLLEKSIKRSEVEDVIEDINNLEKKFKLRKKDKNKKKDKIKSNKKESVKKDKKKKKNKGGDNLLLEIANLDTWKW